MARELVEITTASGNAELERAAIREPDVDRERATADSDAPMGGDDTSCGRLGHPEAFSRTTFTSHCSTNHWPTNHSEGSILKRAPRTASRPWESRPLWVPSRAPPRRRRAQTVTIQCGKGSGPDLT